MINILRRIKELKAKEFYDGIDNTPYEYTNKPLAACIKERDSFDTLIARDSEIIGRALQAEMNKSGKPLNKNMYKSVKRKFFKLTTDNKEYANVCDAYLHAGDKAILKYLIATWKHGDELGHVTGLGNQEILALKNDLKDRYMPQVQGTQNFSGLEQNM